MPSTKKVGRPKLDIDPEQVEKLASIDCSYEEMALVFACSVSTLQRNFAQAIEKGRAQGRASLKRKQFEVAMGSPAVFDEDGNQLEAESKPNPTMLIWLGKIRLGQKDTAEIAVAEKQYVIFASPPINAEAWAKRYAPKPESRSSWGEGGGS